MAEKNTLSILETIKKKMHKLDQKSQDEKKVSVDGDDFQYISSGKKAQAPQTSEIKSEPAVAQNNAPKFEDDLGLDALSKPVEKIANAMPARKASGAGSFDDFNLDDLDLDDEEKFPQKPVVKEVSPVKTDEPPFAEDELEEDEDYLEEFEEDEDYEEEVEKEAAAVVDDNVEGGGTDWLGNPIIDETPADDEPKESLEKDIDEELNLDDEEEAKKEPEHAEEDAEDDDLDLELEEESEEHDDHEEEHDEDEEEDDIDLDLEEEHEEVEKHEETEEEHEEDLDLEDLDLEEDEEDHHEESQKDLEPLDLEELEVKEVPKKQEEKKVVNNDDLNFDDLELDEELETPKSQVPVQTPVTPALKQEPAPQQAEVKKPDPIKVEPAKVEPKKVEEPQVEVKKEIPSFKREFAKDPFIDAPLEEKHEVDIEFEKEIMGLKPEVVKHPVNTMPPLQQNNVSTMNQTAVVQQDPSLRDSTVRQVNDSVRKLIDAKNVISGISSFSQGSAFSELAAQLMEPKLEKWFNQNLPELVEKIVREEIKKIIPKE